MSNFTDALAQRWMSLFKLSWGMLEWPSLRRPVFCSYKTYARIKRNVSDHQIISWSTKDALMWFIRWFASRLLSQMNHDQYYYSSRCTIPMRGFHFFIPIREDMSSHVAIKYYSNIKGTLSCQQTCNPSTRHWNCATILNGDVHVSRPWTRTTVFKKTHFYTMLFTVLFKGMFFLTLDWEWKSLLNATKGQWWWVRQLLNSGQVNIHAIFNANAKWAFCSYIIPDDKI